MGHGQTPRILPEPELFVSYEHLRETFVSLSALFKTIYEQKYMEKTDLGYHLCWSISRVFPNDITYLTLDISKFYKFDYPKCKLICTSDKVSQQP